MSADFLLKTTFFMKKICENQLDQRHQRRIKRFSTLTMLISDNFYCDFDALR